MKFIKLFIIFISLILLCCTSTTYQNTIYPRQQPILVFVDESFNRFEEDHIWYAARAWEQTSNGSVKFILYFKMRRPGKLNNFYGKKYKNNSIFIWNIDKSNLDNSLKEKFERYNGLWDRYGNILMFKDTDSYFYNVILHELGHALGLKHDDKKTKSVMHPNAIRGCITDLDSFKLCLIYGCVPKPECTMNKRITYK